MRMLVSSGTTIASSRPACAGTAQDGVYYPHALGSNIVPMGGAIMTVQYLTIEAKHRQGLRYLASLADFSCRPGEAVHPDIVLSDPNLSLYCLDDATQQAIFVELPSSVNLATAPFVYL